jgi:hypothetical protein
LAALEQLYATRYPLCWLLGTSVLRKRLVIRTDVPSSQHRAASTLYEPSKLPDLLLEGSRPIFMIAGPIYVIIYGDCHAYLAEAQQC